jgi:hypothetical protein
METWDIDAVARVLRISPKTVRNRVAAGLPMPPSFVVGRQRLFLQDQVEAWLRSQPGAVREQDVESARLVLRRPGRPRKTAILL